MPSIPPINAGALKVTFPSNLPRNEKDLICMLLAGRLKDLWKGKLVCAQLAIDDLIRDATGVSGLDTLRSSLVDLKSAVNAFKTASGYDKILGGINTALGQVSNVFSLGGLCPSPVTAPKIPDVLGALNQNLFGQANNILNALVQASNPKVCFGGGPAGFGLDWNQVTGSLKLLKSTVKQFKENPANYQQVMAGFTANIQSQRRRLNAEITRLGKNLTDPLGINEKKNTIAAIQRAKQVSDNFPVKDKRGVLYPNPVVMMVPAEVDSVLSRTDPIYSNPVKYQVVPVYNYCGDLVGYEKKIISGDPNYMGWDTVNTDLNTVNPTVNPLPGFAQYDYTFQEQQDNSVRVFNRNGEVVNQITLERGQFYKFGVQLITQKLAIRNGSSIWSHGIKLVKEPDYGIGFEDVTPTPALYCSKITLEFDWAVQIEGPTTPDSLTWSTESGQSGNIVISGITSIPDTDKTYDVSMAYKKAWLHIVERRIEYNTSDYVDYPDLYTRRVYNVDVKIENCEGQNYYKFSEIRYKQDGSPNSYLVEDDTETLNDSALFDEGNKIVKYNVVLDNNKTLVIKRYVNELRGFDLSQVHLYLINTVNPDPDNIILLASLRFDEKFNFLSDIKLPYTDFCDYNLAMNNYRGKLSNREETELRHENTQTGTNRLIMNLSPNRTISDVAVNEFIFTSELDVSSQDLDRMYISTNPRERRSFMYFRGANNFTVSIETTYSYDLSGS